jgi:hypothetical protein
LNLLYAKFQSGGGGSLSNVIDANLLSMLMYPVGGNMHKSKTQAFLIILDYHCLISAS